MTNNIFKTFFKNAPVASHCHYTTEARSKIKMEITEQDEFMIEQQHVMATDMMHYWIISV